MNLKQWYDLSPDEIAMELAGMDYSLSANDLALLYRRAQSLILEGVRRALTARPSQQAMQMHALLSQVTRRYKEVLKAADAWARRDLQKAFRAGAHDAEFGLTRQGTAALRTTFTQVPVRALDAITQDTMRDILAATSRTEQRVKDVVRRVVHVDSQVAVASGLNGNDIAKHIAQNLRDENVFGITTSNGRFIPVDEYARIVGRTKLAHAHTTGTEQMLLANDVDLVRVTVHTHRPDVCSPLEGKVYSLTGRTPGYPQLPKHTPFHPNCRHRETPYITTFRSDEEIERIRQESNTPGQITVQDPEKLAAKIAEQDKRARYMAAKRQIRKQDQADIVAGKRDAPKDQKAYERSLTARANALARKRERLASERGIPASEEREARGKRPPDSQKGAGTRKRTQKEADTGRGFDGPGAAPSDYGGIHKNALDFPLPPKEARNWLHSQTPKQISDWSTDHAEAWNASTPPDELRAMGLYKGYRDPRWPNHDFYDLINRQARFDAGQGDDSFIHDYPHGMIVEANRLLPALDSSIKRGILEENTVLYRGFGSTNRKLEFVVGEEFDAGSFWSSSISRTEAERFRKRKPYIDGGVYTEIRAPKGTHAAFPDKLGVFEDQFEVSLSRFCKFKVLQVLPPDGRRKYTRLLLEVVSDGVS